MAAAFGVIDPQTVNTVVTAVACLTVVIVLVRYVWLPLSSGEGSRLAELETENRRLRAELDRLRADELEDENRRLRDELDRARADQRY